MVSPLDNRLSPAVIEHLPPDLDYSALLSCVDRNLLVLAQFTKVWQVVACVGTPQQITNSLGADRFPVSRIGTALDFAALTGNFEGVQLFLGNLKQDPRFNDAAKKQYIQQALYSAARGGADKVMQLLVQEGADAKLCEGHELDGGTKTSIVHLAAQSGLVPAIKYALKLCPEPSLDAKGQTPLFHVNPASIKAAQYLIEAGFNVQDKNSQGKTPVVTVAPGPVWKYLKNPKKYEAAQNAAPKPMSFRKALGALFSNPKQSSQPPDPRTQTPSFKG